MVSERFTGVCVWVCVCLLCAQPTLRALGYAALLVSKMWLGVSGKAPRANGRVVRVATVVFPEVLLLEPLRHESVRGRAAVTQTDTLTKTNAKHFS